MVSKKSKQWFRPGHGRMVSYKRVGGRYFVTGSKKSQYKPRKFKALPVLDEFPITPGEAAIIRDLRTPQTRMVVDENPFYVTPTPVPNPMWNPYNSVGYGQFGRKRSIDSNDVTMAIVSPVDHRARQARRMDQFARITQLVRTRRRNGM